MEKLKKYLPYLLIDVLAFYGLPFFIRDTGTAMFILLLVLPVICFITALIFGRKYKFHITYTLAVAVLFTPSLFLFYNKSAWIYVPTFAGISLIGNLLGYMFHHEDEE